MATKPETVVELIKSAINGNHLIHDASHISIEPKTTGFMFWKKTEIHVTGRTDTDREKEEIDKIVASEAHGFPVVTEIRVQRR